MHHAILHKDGSIAIMTLVDEKADISSEINKWSNKDDYVDHYPVDITKLPDSQFSAAWVSNNQIISIDLTKAIQVALKNLRTARDPLLIKYDGLQMRASDLNDSAALSDIKAKKQMLRDTTNALKALVPSTLEDIKTAIPDLSGY